MAQLRDWSEARAAQVRFISSVGFKVLGFSLYPFRARFIPTGSYHLLLLLQGSKATKQTKAQLLASA